MDLSESKAWNVARSYSEIKIMKFLVLADEYETLATFGVNELIEEFQTDRNAKSFVRIRALYWFNKILLMLINNTMMLVKIKDREKLVTYKRYLLELKKIIEIIDEDSKKRKKDGNYEYVIDEKKFELVLFLMSEIKTEINEPLNKSELIYTSMDEYDPAKIKAEVMKRLTEIG